MNALAGTAMIVSLSAMVAVEGAHAQSGGSQGATSSAISLGAIDSGIELAREVVAEGLEDPWAIGVLPSGEFLVTERPGRMRVILADGRLSEPVAGLPETYHASEGTGLQDVAVGPDFARDRMIYWTYSKPMGDGMSATAAARGRLSEDMSEVTGVEDIFVQRPPSPTPSEYGSRLAFDNEGHVFITIGEPFANREMAGQDLGTVFGKVIRVNLDGSLPADNPYAEDADVLSVIWSHGHRGVLGAEVNPATETLWTIEHGMDGERLNIVEGGVNYGTPVIRLGESGAGNAGETAAPVHSWDPVIAFSGMTFYDGPMFEGWRNDLIIASLAPGGLFRVDIEGNRAVGEERLIGETAPVRDVAMAPDGAILALTGGDDDGRVLRLTPESAPG